MGVYLDLFLGSIWKWFNARSRVHKGCIMVKPNYESNHVYKVGLKKTQGYFAPHNISNSGCLHTSF